MRDAQAAKAAQLRDAKADHEQVVAKTAELREKLDAMKGWAPLPDALSKVRTREQLRQPPLSQPQPHASAGPALFIRTAVCDQLLWPAMQVQTMVLSAAKYFSTGP